ncbi:unnamed protein product [Rotaria sp. Silwood1]|nr:unnamed protein product [Rotaria sp. Silwood1]
MYWNTHLTETAQRYADHCNFDHDKLIQRQVPHIPLPTAMSLKTWALAIQDCHGLVCLYNEIIDLDSYKCQCESYATSKQCENLDCTLLSDDCKYGNDKSLCTQYSNISNECPKFCGLCSRYDEMKKYYDSLEILSNIGIQTIESTQSVISFRNMSFHLVFI